MKKLLIPVIVTIVIIVGGGKAYKYFNGPKIIDGTISKSVDDMGKPTNITTTFSPKDTVYFSAKGKRFLVKKATVVWYKGKVATVNRFKVQEDIDMSSDRYFSANLSVPEGLQEGHYSVSIYADDSEIIQARGEFDVKK